MFSRNAIGVRAGGSEPLIARTPLALQLRSCFKTVATFARTWEKLATPPTFWRTWLRRTRVLKLPLNENVSGQTWEGTTPVAFVLA